MGILFMNVFFMQNNLNKASPMKLVLRKRGCLLISESDSILRDQGLEPHLACD